MKTYEDTPTTDPIPYNWDALFGDCKIKVDKYRPDWILSSGPAFSDWDIYVDVGEGPFGNISVYVSPECWDEYSWLTKLNKDEIKSLMAYCHSRKPFIPLPEANSDVLAGLTRAGVLCFDPESKKRWWKR